MQAMSLGEGSCVKAAETSIDSPVPSGNGSLSVSCIPQAPCSKLGRDNSAPCLTRKASQTSLHRPGGSTPGMPPPLLSGGSCPGVGGKGCSTDRDGQKPAPRGFGSSTGRGLMEARFRRTASAVSVRGEARCTLPRGGEREKGANNSSQQIGVSVEGGSTCSSSLAVADTPLQQSATVGNVGPSRSGTAPRQRGSTTGTTSSFSAAHAQLMSQDGTRGSQGLVQRVMADDGLDVDVGLADRLRERIRSRLGGATGERGSSGATTETSTAGEFRRDTRPSHTGTSCSSRRTMDSRLRRQPQPQPAVAQQRASHTSPVTNSTATVTGFRPAASSSASTVGVTAIGPSRSPIVPVVKALPQSTTMPSEQTVVASCVRRESSPLKPQRVRSPSPLTVPPEPTVVTSSVTREPSPLKPHRSPEASRTGPSRSSSGRYQGAFATGPGQPGFARSSSSCSRAGRSPSPSDHESTAPARVPHLTRQASGFFLESASTTSLRSSSSLAHILGHRQAGAPPVATSNASITRLVSGLHSDSGRSSGSVTPARQDESDEMVVEDEIQACAVAFERALSRVQMDSSVCAELRRVREKYEALLHRFAPSSGVHSVDPRLQLASASSLHRLERENAELQEKLAETRLQLQAAQAHASDCRSVLNIPETLTVSASCSPMAPSLVRETTHGQTALQTQVQASPLRNDMPSVTHQGKTYVGDVSVLDSEEESQSPLPPMRRIFAPPTPAVTPLKGEPGIAPHSQLAKSPGLLAWANLVDKDIVDGSDSVPRHPVRTPPLGGSQKLPVAIGSGRGSDKHEEQSTPGIVRSDVVTPRATPPVSNPPRPVSWTAPPVLRCSRGDDEGDDLAESARGGNGQVFETESPRRSDEGSPSPGPSRREAMASAWLKEIDSLAMSCRSDQSDSLPQRPQRRVVSRPSSVPPLNLTGLCGICPEESDGEGMTIGMDDSSYMESSGLLVPQKPSPTTKMIRDVSMEVPGPLPDTCGSSGNGGSSTASTRAASTPSANTAGGPPSPCPQVTLAPQTFVTKLGKVA